RIANRAFSLFATRYSPFAPSSNRKALVRRRVEQLFGRDEARGEPLRMVVPQERLEHLAVRSEPIGPEVVAHELAREAQLILHERQRHFGCRGILERLHALRL